jgi:probable HAF family extracellular repeat protein
MEEYMKTNLTMILTTIAASGLFATLALAQTPRYTVTDLGTMGGTFGSAYGINYEGRVAGAGTLANGNTHAFLTGFPGAMYDLGTLGGPNSNEGGLNASYQMAIFAETSQKDPLGENFCGFGTPYICLAAIWNGTMTPLPTLGGNNGLAFAINDRGQVAGIAENSAKDPSCVAPQVLDFEAVLWGPNPGQVQALPPLPGDTVGFALWLNNNGQVVGSSGTCANTVLVPLAVGPHAVLWENGSPIDLGSLGGTMIAVAAGINDLGEVDGATDLASENPGFPGVQVHGFLWTKAAGIEDIGTVGTDFSSLPTSINNNGQIVGSSCDNMGNCRVFLWQNKVMMDLNALIPANSPLYLMSAYGLNDAGEIAGMALETSTGAVHAFVATPGELPAAGKDFSPVSPTAAKPMALPENVRRLLEQRLRVGRLGAPFPQPR